MASPKPIEGLSSNPAKRRLSTTVQAGTSPHIPNIPPRTSTPSSNIPHSLTSSYKPHNASFSRQARSPSNSLTPKPSVDALVVDKKPPKAQTATSALTAQLGSSPTPVASTPPIEHSVSRKGSTSLRPDNNRTISGHSTPRKNDSSFSNLADVPNEEKAKVLARHLVSAEERTGRDTISPGPSSPTKEVSPSGSGRGRGAGESGVSGVSGYGSIDDAGRADDAFSIPYHAPGMDVTHDLYKWQQDHANPRPTRSASFSHVPLDRSALLDPTLAHIKEPGGFRRNFVAAKAQETGQEAPAMARNLVDFLFLYGHFAGEDLDEYDDDDEEDEVEEAEEGRGGPSRPVARRDPSAMGERQPLIGSRSYSKSRIRRGPGQGSATVTQATLMLLKGFVGTGILFMGKAFLNGGILFSTIVLLSIAGISLFSFLLLTQTYLVVPGSFGDIGGQLYGSNMRFAILISITVSQIGFVAAYTIFIADNLQAFILAVSDCRTYISIKYLIFAQLAVFLPLAMIRNLAKLSGTALVADAFILIGLIYIGVNETSVISTHGIADVVLFNRDSFPLLIGTAVFAFEGIGLVIPITESMKEPTKFPRVLSGVMFFVAVLFAGFGVLGYAAYGSNIQTVVIVNLPQDDKFVQAVQFLYSVAILLSIPLQLFPAVRIMENGLFSRSGKHNSSVKWQKNVFRAGTVICCSLISWAGSAELDKFVSLIGAFACIPLCFIYPPMLHLKACARTRTAKAVDYTLITFGVVVGLYTTVQTIRSLFVPSGGHTQFGKCEIPVGL